MAGDGGALGGTDGSGMPGTGEGGRAGKGTGGGVWITLGSGAFWSAPPAMMELTAPPATHDGLESMNTICSTDTSMLPSEPMATSWGPPPAGRVASVLPKCNMP